MYIDRHPNSGFVHPRRVSGMLFRATKVILPGLTVWSAFLKICAPLAFESAVYYQVSWASPLRWMKVMTGPHDNRRPNLRSTSRESGWGFILGSPFCLPCLLVSFRRDLLRMP
jgi:hypothetical protein